MFKKQKLQCSAPWIFENSMILLFIKSIFLLQNSLTTTEIRLNCF
ncbi:MAG: hypothetical protein ACI9A7_001989 [Cyclobacteriaceae bacterium]